MPRRRSRSEVWDAAHQTAGRLHDQDEKAAAVAERERTQGTTLPLEQILDRETDTRPLKSQHVTQLAESLAVLGLLEPLVVDNRGRLLAGGHRKAAIATIRENNSQAFAQHFPDNLIPVRMMPFDADEDPEQALQVEISENEKRRDYTPNEVRALASRLRAAGYVDSPGRPSLGEKRLRPALEVIIGKSLRSVRRYLTEEKPVQVGQVSKKTALRQAKRALAQWASLVDEEKHTRTEKQLVKKLPQLLELIEKAITEG